MVIFALCDRRRCAYEAQDEKLLRRGEEFRTLAGLSDEELERFAIGSVVVDNKHDGLKSAMEAPDDDDRSGYWHTPTHQIRYAPQCVLDQINEKTETGQ
jgi:hypothetical protein